MKIIDFNPKQICKIIILIISTCITLSTSGQNDRKDKADCLLYPNRIWAFSGELIAQHPFSTGINVVRTSIREPSLEMPADGQEIMAFLQFSYLHLGTEISYAPKFRYAPKFGYGFNILIFNANVSYILHHNNWKSLHHVIKPEIGLSFLGQSYINYGHNISILNNGFTEVIPKHNVTFRFVLFLNHGEPFTLIPL